MRKIIENVVIWLSIIVFVVLLYTQFSDGSIINGKVQKISFSEFLENVHSGRVEQVVLEGYDVHEISGKFKDGTYFKTKSIGYSGLISDLRSNNIAFEVVTGESVLGFILGMFFSWVPMLLLIGVWVFFMKQMQSGGNKTMSFGKSRARMTSDKKNKTTFADVAGIDEAKEELMEIVDFLKDPHKFQILGGKIPKGCLLVGPPGTGKTLLAKAIAGEAKVPFFTISGSDFVEMFVGVGASRVRDMFDQGKKNAPCLIFIDEIDAVGRHRGIGIGGGNDEREQTLNQLLVEMDGFETNEGVIIIAATNRPDVLDPALLRPGRFDRQIVISVPDIAGREKIIITHIKKGVPTAPDVNVRIIARGTPGFSGADLSNLVNEAALIAARKNKKIVTMDDFEYARDKVMMGAERRSLVMRDEEKKLTAYHEAGHAIAAIMLPASDPIHKATIIPRGRSLGLVMRIPEHDRVSLTREKMHADLVVAMAGRVAEEIIFGYDKVTSGASSDLKQATKLATLMVTKWGMSDKVGSVYFDEESNVSLISDDAKRICNEEVRQILEQVKNESKKIIEENIDKLHAIAKALLEYETLSGDEIKDIIDGKKVRESTSSDQEGSKKSSISSDGDVH